MAQYGPPSVAGSINEGVESILGGIKDYRTGQMLENLPKTADGSIDYRAAAAAMYRTNPGLAAQFLKMEELKGLQDYRRRALDIQEKGLEDKGQIIRGEGKQWIYGPGQVLRGSVDEETGVFTPAGRGQTGPLASPQPQARPASEPPPEAIEILRKRPETADQFEKHFGLPPGSAKRYLSPETATTPAPAATAPVAPVPAPAPAPAPAPVAGGYPAKRLPGESHAAWKAREKKLAEDMGNIDQTKLKDADDSIQAGISSAKDLVDLIRLNKQSMSGWPAVAAPLAAQFGNTKASNTQIMDNMLKAGALSQLKTVFGTAPSNAENRILREIQGGVTQPEGVRGDIWQRALEAVQRKVKYNQKYVRAVRAGNQQLMPAYTDDLDIDSIKVGN